MPLQYFALDSTHGDFAAAMTALATVNAANFSYTPTLVQRAASHDSDIKIVAAVVTDADLTGDLAFLHPDNFSNALCRDRFVDTDDFRVRGFHMLGESIRSSESVAGRPMKYIRHNRDGNNTQWGDGNGFTHYDAFHGPQDTAINGGTNENHQPGSYAYCGIVFQISRSYSTSQGQIDFTKDGDPANYTLIRMDHPLDPGLMFQSGVKQVPSGLTCLPWDVYSGDCYVQGNYAMDQGTAAVGTQTTMMVAGYSPTLNSEELEDRSIISVAADLATCISTAETFSQMGDGSSANLTPTQVWQFDESAGTYTDITAAFNNATANDAGFPAPPAAGDKIYVGYSAPYSLLALNIGTAGAGTYTTTLKYYNGSAETAFTSVVDHSTNLKLTGTRLLCVNPKADWAQQTVNSVAAYYIVLELNAGTMTTAPLVTQGWARQGALYVHLHSDGNPNDFAVFDVLQWSRHGYHWGWNSTGTRLGGIHLVRCNIMNTGELGSMMAPSNARSVFQGDIPLEVHMLGGRYMLSATFYQNGQCDKWIVGKATDGRCLYDTSNRPTYANNVGWQDIVDNQGGDASLFSAAAVSHWSEMSYGLVGPHYSQSVGGGGFPTTGGSPDIWHVSGLFYRGAGGEFKNLSWDNFDSHTLAIRGGTGTPGVKDWLWEQVYSKGGFAHIHPYITADAGGSLPIAGNSQDLRDMTIQDIVTDGTFSDRANGAGIFGFHNGGNNTHVLRDNGTGVINLTQRRLVAMNHKGSGYIQAWGQNVLPETMFFLGNYSDWFCLGQGQSESLYVVVQDADADTWTNNTVNAYSATAFDLMPAAPAVGDRLWIGRKRDSFRAPVLNITTQGVGSGLTGKWRYPTAATTLADISTGGSYTDGTTSLTAATGSRTLDYDRPADWVATDFGGKLPGSYYWICFEITAGTYTTVPRANDLNGPLTGHYFVATEADRFRHYDTRDAWIYISGLNAFYETDARVNVLDRIKARLLPGETIATKQIVWRQTSGSPSKYTLAQIQAGQFDKTRVTSDAWEDNTGLLANVSSTPGVDIIEVP